MKITSHSAFCTLNFFLPLQPKMLIMCELKSLTIDLKGLEEGITTSTLELGEAFFSAANGTEVRKGKVIADLSIRKTETYFELSSHLSGVVVIPCTRCLDEMEQHIDTTNMLTIKFGEEYSEDDDLVVVPEDEGTIDITWFLYEYIALAIPIQHVHETGKCNVAMMKVLQQHSATRSSDGNEHTDPRWEKLKDLKIED